MTRDDAVSPTLAAEVFERDRKIIEREWRPGSTARSTRFMWAFDRLHWNDHGWRVICPAVIIDPNEYGNCWGRFRIEHVKKEPRIGKRAEPLASHLMSICEGHAEPGMKAGRVWVTRKANRQRQRDYLERANRAT